VGKPPDNDARARPKLSLRFATAQSPSPPEAKLPAGIWALGFVSLLTDVGSEMVHGLLPVLLAGSLSASMFVIGLLEGAAEAIALIVKVFSGYISDRMRKRKLLALLGYGMSAFVKPLFPLAGSVAGVVTARCLDRVGKGIRGAPRDALVGQLAPPEARGAAFGLRQSLDTIGAVLGPLLAIVLMSVLLGDIRTVLWFAVIPGVLGVLVLAVAVREPPNPTAESRSLPITREGLAQLGRRYWQTMLVGALLSLARFSEAFLVLRASERGLSNTWVPAVLVIMSLVYSLTAYPAGRVSDRMSRRSILAFGMVALVLADVVLAWATTPTMVLIGVAIWGVHMGASQGILAAMITDVTAPEYRGTAFGVFGLISGVAVLLASAVAGVLWDQVSPAAPFWAGAGLALATMASLLLLPRRIDSD
jgi:MFS family permease